MKGSVLVALLLPVVLAAPVLRQQFQARVDVVRLDVIVTDDSGHVHGLVASDFIVEDRGARQTVTAEEFTDTPLDLVVVAPPLSSVAFIAADQRERVALGIEAFINQVEDRDRLGVVLASPPPRQIRALESGRPTFDSEPFGAGNHFYSASFDAIAMGLRVFVPSGRRQVLVAFTNAADFRSVLREDAVAALTGRLGPAFVVVGTPVTVDMSVGASAELRDGRSIGQPVEGRISSHLISSALEGFVSKTGGLLVNLGDGHPRDVMSQLMTSLRSRYVLTYALPKGEGWHPVKVSVNRRGATVRVREGYVVQ